jgi:glycosyltransferase involved in cell wall biosynthesis
MKRAVFVCLPGLETFVDQVANALSNDYLIEKCYANNLSQVQQSIANADIVWLEWANEMAVSVTTSLLPLARAKKVIVRLHSYEALNPQYLNAINWGNVTDLVYVSDYLKNYVNGIIPQHLGHLRQHVIPNGLDIDKFSIADYKYEEQSKLLTIGILGHLNNKKGPMMLAQSIYEIYDYNRTFELYDNVRFVVGGEWQDPRYETYFYHFLEKLGLMSKVDFSKVPYGGASTFFTDIDVVLCTSPWESQNMSVMEGMASGCKPAIHWFPGAEYHYDLKSLWLTTAQLCEIVYLQTSKPDDYRHYLKSNGYDISATTDRLKREVLC